MKCQDFLERMDEYREGSLSPFEQEAATAHLHSCTRCEQYVARAQTLRHALRELPVAEPRREFFDHALARAVAPQRRQPAWWTYGISVALAASIALWIGANWLPRETSPSERLAAVTISLHEPKTVQLAFNAASELEQATLSIRLPDGIEVDGFPGEREIRWETNLARGVNVLSLPLVAKAPSSGALLARLEHGERATEIAVPVRVSAGTRGSTRIDRFAHEDATTKVLGS